MRLKLMGFLLVLMTSISVGMSAQDIKNAFVVKGVVVDSLTKVGEPYVTIRIYSMEQGPKKPVHMMVSDGKGKFEGELKKTGKYVITLSSVGKKPIMNRFILSETKKVADLGTILMSEAAEMLKGVEIVAQKPLVKAEVDRLTYSVEDDPDAQVNTIMEMLRKVPMVSVDGNDNILVNGSRSFLVYMNGKPNNMMTSNPKEVMSSIPANTVKSIEVITNPGARYDAEGIGGVLNIVTMERKKITGYTGTLNGGVNNRGAEAGAFVTMQSGKFMLMANYSYTHTGNLKEYEENGREDYTSEEYKYQNNEVWSKRHNNFHFATVEASYEMDKRNLISFSLNMSKFNYKQYGDGLSEMKNAQHQHVYSYNLKNRLAMDMETMDASVDYQHAFKKAGELLTLSYRLSTSPTVTETKTEYMDIVDYPYDAEYLQNQFYDNEHRMNEHTFQVDYINPINKVHSIGVGSKFILRENLSEAYYYKDFNGNYQLVDELTDNYEQNRNILAAYADYQMKWKKWVGRVGARYEHTFMNVEYERLGDKSFDTDFDDLVPSVMFSFKPNRSQTINLGYDMRISRPSIRHLNPFCDTSNPTYITYGNPDLETEKAHRFRLGHSLFVGKVNVNATLTHTFVNNSIERYSFINNEVMETTYGNIGKMRNTNLGLWVNWNPGRKTRISLNGSGSYKDYKCDETFLKKSNSGFVGNLSMNVQQTLPWNLRLSVNASGSTPNITLQGESMASWSHGISLSRSFLKENRLRVTLNSNNLFTGKFDYDQDVYADTFHSWVNSRIKNRSFGINVSWRFGDLKESVKKTKRTIKNNDVKAVE